MENKRELPEALLEWAAQIEATRRPYLQLKPVANVTLSPAQSRLGGTPYWPIEMEYPTRTNGTPLYLLIQLNFSEMPPLGPLPGQGILQIFIADDPVYGMDYQWPLLQEDFRVVYHPDPVDGKDLVQDFSFLSEPEDLPMPWGEVFGLDFARQEGPAPAESPEFIQQLGEDFFSRFGPRKWHIMAEYQRFTAAAGHKLGGYPHFPQDDPREKGQTPFLLLQLDSDTQTGLIWGDRGTAHFFIDPADLLELNFADRVFYSWSSY